MLLSIRKIFFMLLLAPVALTTPVPGKELVTTQDTIVPRGAPPLKGYKPDLDRLCTRRGQPGDFNFALDYGRACLDYHTFKFDCVQNKGHSVLQSRYSTGRCKVGHYCYETLEYTELPAPSNYQGRKGIWCVEIDLNLSVELTAGVREGQTELSQKPPGPVGTMVGVIQLSGDVRGFRPALDWKYVDKSRPGKNLLGEKVVSNAENESRTQLYGIRYNYANEAQFFAAVRYLSPKHKDPIKLDMFLTWMTPKPDLINPDR